MKAILLAAGVGTRISRYINEIPKSTVELGDGDTLIEHTVRTLRAKGVTQIAVVVGYRHQLVRTALQGHDVRYFVNPFFRVTNSVASLWFAREMLEGDVLVMNADPFLEDAIYDALMGEERSPVMLGDSSRPYDQMDYKLGCEGGTICAYGKELRPHDTDMEYVGAAKIAARDVTTFRTRLEAMVDNSMNERWWEDVLYEMSSEGLLDVHVRDVAGSFWAEVDYVEDYFRIREFIAGAHA